MDVVSNKTFPIT